MIRQLTLPDDLTVFSLNADETRFVHREVFGERCYLQHGIKLHDGDCVFDVGAVLELSPTAQTGWRRRRRGAPQAAEPSPGMDDRSGLVPDPYGD